jgi:hypothetical protein
MPGRRRSEVVSDLTEFDLAHDRFSTVQGDVQSVANFNMTGP